MDDIDPIETNEWLDSLDSILENEGEERACYIITRLLKHTRLKSMPALNTITTPYRNSIPSNEEIKLPGDFHMERRIRSLIRWNALVMVMRANIQDSSLGGHISTFASSALLYDIGFNHFFHGPDDGRNSDLIYYQGHASPGIYARAFLEGRITENQLNNFRRESDSQGLSSYPHPWLMPDFWQFPTVSMGLGPLQAIFQARFLQYMINRELLPDQNRKIWAFLGDGEMDEPESLGSISLAGREKLDNLIFVVNCNLQRLDGPVRGNGKIIQELESVFIGAGWNVIKVVWGRYWDPLFAKDISGKLQEVMDSTVDGDYQNCKAKGGAWTRENFFGRTPETLKLVEDLSDDDIWHLNRGGHDPYKIYTAYHSAVHHKGQPTVILAKTVKGYGTGKTGESANISHNIKKLPLEDMKHFRDRFNLPFKDNELEKLPFYKPDENSEEMVYMRQRRKQLGGYIPQRRRESDEKLSIPELGVFSTLTKGSGDRKISTTMAYVRILSILTKDKTLKNHIVPIIPDEARTFGMEGMFRQLGIYASEGQKYQPVDSDQVMYYKESKTGQILQEGINEAGSHALWIAAATSYSTHNIPMIPFYSFYSMFGFQRTGDLAWAAGDIRARGFLIGATSGRTTLNGEGLQHEDGHSHIIASTIPNCISYDPTFSYELAVIIQEGLKRMYQKCDNVWYYITTMNENYIHPAMPEEKNITEGIIKGLYLLKKPPTKTNNLTAHLMGCGSILNEVLKASEILEQDFNVVCTVWSATSFNELRRNGLEITRWNMLNPNAKTKKKSWVEHNLGGLSGPVIAATDYMKLYADQIRDFVPQTFISLGTDGFGRSDTRQNLRRFFEVDRYFITIAALSGLVKDNLLKSDVVINAMKKFNIDPKKNDPFFY